MKKYLEKKRRSDIIFGIMLASTLGVLLNLFSNLYYDVLISKTVKTENINWDHVIAWFFILLATWGFISFFIYDYENEFKMNISFWKRFFNYFFESFKPVRIIRIIVGAYLILFMLALSFVLLMTVFLAIKEIINTMVASVVVFAVIIIGLIFIYKKYLKKK